MQIYQVRTLVYRCVKLGLEGIGRKNWSNWTRPPGYAYGPVIADLKRVASLLKFLASRLSAHTLYCIAFELRASLVCIAVYVMKNISVNRSNNERARNRLENRSITAEFQEQSVSLNKIFRPGECSVDRAVDCKGDNNWEYNIRGPDRYESGMPGSCPRPFPGSLFSTSCTRPISSSSPTDQFIDPNLVRACTLYRGGQDFQFIIVKIFHVSS